MPTTAHTSTKTAATAATSHLTTRAIYVGGSGCSVGLRFFCWLSVFMIMDSVAMTGEGAP